MRSMVERATLGRAGGQPHVATVRDQGVDPVLPRWLPSDAPVAAFDLELIFRPCRG